MLIIGTSGGDFRSGTSGDDIFDLTQGGNDKATAGLGDDTFKLGAAFTAADRLNGAFGNDTLGLAGDYSAGIAFNNYTIKSVENIHLGNGYSYDLTLADANVAAGGHLTLDGSDLSGSNNLIFNGSAERDGSFTILGGQGNDNLWGGAQDDVFDLRRGGADVVRGGAGNDMIVMGSSFTATDRINGGAGSDTLILDGGERHVVNFGPGTLVNVENVDLTAGHSYDFRPDDATIHAGRSLTIDGSALGIDDRLIFFGSNEKDGSFNITTGTGDDFMTGGAGNDTFDISAGGTDVVHAGNGNDTIIAGASYDISDGIDGDGGNDTLLLDGDYGSAASRVSFDTSIETVMLNGDHDYYFSLVDLSLPSYKFDATNLGAGHFFDIDATAEGNASVFFLGGGGDDVVHSGYSADFFWGAGGHNTMVYVSHDQSNYLHADVVYQFNAGTDTFDFDFAIASVHGLTGVTLSDYEGGLSSVTAGHLDAHGAVTVGVTGGPVAGHTFLVVDANGDAAYTASDDYLIDITGVSGTVTTANFI